MPDRQSQAGQNGRGVGYAGPGVDEQMVHGHRIVQAGMSDDAMPIYRCRGCGWSRVGRLPEHHDPPCKVPTVWALYRVEGDGREVHGYTFVSVHISRESAERATNNRGPYDIRELPLVGATA